NEIAQSEGATGKQFSRFWFHIEHLLVDNQKMSKSVGNVYTVQDVLDKGFRLSALRYILLSGYYRKQLNFTWIGLEQAEEAPRRRCDAADPAGRDRRRDPGPSRGATQARLCGSRSHPAGSARQGRDPRRRAAGDKVEAEIGRRRYQIQISDLGSI